MPPPRLPPQQQQQQQQQHHHHHQQPPQQSLQKQQQQQQQQQQKPPPLPRIITYHQTHHHPTTNAPISLLPLLTQPNIALTHLILAAVHINEDAHALTLNDHPPHHERFQTLWAELRVLQAAGVKVLLMLGGAAKGTFGRLDLGPYDDDDDNNDNTTNTSTRNNSNEDEDDQDTLGKGNITNLDKVSKFEEYYAPLHNLIHLHKIDGIDLDVEEDMSLAGITRLIDRLRSDFGPNFIITLAPVAAALLDPTKNLSGFDYEALEVLRGREIAWYNAQFYCGWGDLSDERMYNLILQRGWPPEKVVVGLVTNPANGEGFVLGHAIAPLLASLARRQQSSAFSSSTLSSFAGVMGWEYFNALPGDASRPWEWAQLMTSLLRPHHAIAAAEPSPQPAQALLPPAIDSDEDEAPGASNVPEPFEYHSDHAHQET